MSEKNADSLKHVLIGISSKKIIAFINRTKTIGYVRGFSDKKTRRNGVLFYIDKTLIVFVL